MTEKTAEKPVNRVVNNKAEGRKLWESGAEESGGGGGGKGAVPRNIRPFAHYTVGPEGSRIGRT